MNRIFGKNDSQRFRRQPDWPQMRTPQGTRVRPYVLVMSLLLSQP